MRAYKGEGDSFVSAVLQLLQGGFWVGGVGSHPAPGSPPRCVAARASHISCFG